MNSRRTSPKKQRKKTQVGGEQIPSCATIKFLQIVYVLLSAFYLSWLAVPAAAFS
jgi:hypothetical protein